MKLTVALLFTVAGLGYCSQSNADCYVHSKIRLSRPAIVAGPTDVQRMAIPDSKGFKCVTNYRVYINKQWYTAEGSATARTESEACNQAMDLGRGSVLAEVEPNRVTSDMSLICSDIPAIQIRPVRVGETIWESETDLHTEKSEQKYFFYKRDRCRYFTEQAVRENNMITYQGIICKKNSQPNSKWQVVDKF
jgi:hypothetical protein